MSTYAGFKKDISFRLAHKKAYVGIENTPEKQVELLVDGALREVPRLGFHPCDNSRSLAMAGEDFFERFLPAVGRAPRWVEIHDFQEVDAP